MGQIADSRALLWIPYEMLVATFWLQTLMRLQTRFRFHGNRFFFLLAISSREKDVRDGLRLHYFFGNTIDNNWNTPGTTRGTNNLKLSILGLTTIWRELKNHSSVGGISFEFLDD